MTEYVATYKSENLEAYGTSVAASVTVDAGDYLVAVMFAATGRTMIETCAGGGLTWTSAGSSVDPSDGGARLGVWITQAPAAQSFTVNVTSASNTSRGLFVQRFANSSGVGVSSSGYLGWPSNGVQPSLTVPNVTGGSVLLSFTLYERGGSGARTYRLVDGIPIVELDYYTRSGGYYTMCAGMAVTDTPGAKTVGLTSPVSDYEGARMVAVELLSAAAPTGPEPGRWLQFF